MMMMMTVNHRFAARAVDGEAPHDLVARLYSANPGGVTAPAVVIEVRRSE